MISDKPLVNKVAQKALVTLDLENYFPKEEEMILIDMKQFLFKEMILKEADFRAQIESTDWTQYQDKYVGIYCSVNAVIPFWAYMVVTAELSPFAKEVVNGAEEQLPELFLYSNIERININEFEGQRVIVKGCGDKKIDAAAFVLITKKIAPVVRSILYGEPCSTVPVYKKIVP